MKIRQAVFPVAFLGLLLLIAGCDNNTCAEKAEKKEPPTYSQGTRLPTGAEYKAGIAVALADMDGDGDLDLVSVVPEGVKYFENFGGGKFTDHGVIATTGVEHKKAGVSIAIADIDGDGVLDIVIAVPEGIRIIKNSVPQKK